MKKCFSIGFLFFLFKKVFLIEQLFLDKGVSIWDKVFHDNSSQFVIDGTDGDVACDSYHQWQRDIEMASELGVHLYR